MVQLFILTSLFVFIEVIGANKIYYTGGIAEINNDKLIVIPIPSDLPDKNTMIRDLFNTFDNLPKDQYLGYREIKIFQYLTNPELPLNMNLWLWICNLLESNPRIGIDMHAFNASYYMPAQDIMGTDIARDWYRVHNAARSGNWI